MTRRPFVLRVQAADPALAGALAASLVEPLKLRGARVLMDGALQGGSGFGVHIVTDTRALPGIKAHAAPEAPSSGALPAARIHIGVWDEDDGARWLAPLDVNDTNTASAADEIMRFLERWGFLVAPVLRSNSPA